MSSYKAISQLKKKYDWDKLTPSDKHRLVSSQMTFIPQNDFENHSRLIVSINDLKYGVNGLYFSDVTWDNDLNSNNYNHALMTSDKTISSNNKIKLSTNSDELFYCNDINEFYDKINYILNHKNDSSNLKNKSDEECLKDLINELIIILNKLDNEFVTSLRTKYQNMDDVNFYKNNQCKELLFDLGSYITSKFNNSIDGDTLLSAIRVIYKGVYENGIKESEVGSIINNNNKDNVFEFGDNIFARKNK